MLSGELVKDIVIWVIVIGGLRLAGFFGDEKRNQSSSEESIEHRIEWQLQKIRELANVIAVVLVLILVILAIQFTVD